MAALDAGRILFAAEELLERTLESARALKGAANARWWPRTKADVRGRACHCAPGAPLHLVHSEGLREGADIVVDYGTNVGSPRRQVPVKALARIAREVSPGDVVHIKTNLLGEFLRNVFPKIEAPIILVTGDADYSPVRDHEFLLEEPRIIHWFAQNCDVSYRHPRLTRIPIGMDNPRYTRMEKRIGFLIEMALAKSPLDPSLSRNDIGDQKRLQEIAAKQSCDVRAKPARALCTFHMNQKLVANFADIPDRLDAYETLRGNPDCHFVPHRLLQDECWKIHADFGFEISPRGKGLDCFRTWESLFLGTIPIVKTTSLDPLYIDENFPVVIVESWREITRANLQHWKEEMQDRFTPEMVRRLTNDYWLEKIRAAAAPYRPGAPARLLEQ